MTLKNKFFADDLRTLLAAVAEEYDKREGEPLTVVIIGGSAAVFQFDFYTTTRDIDYMLEKPSPLFLECVKSVGERLNLQGRWMHEQSVAREKYAVGLKKVFFSGSTPLPIKSERVSFRVQGRDWYLAIKAKVFRRYRHDATDILGLLIEEKSQGRKITGADIKNFYDGIYGLVRPPHPEVINFLETLDNCPDLEKLRELYLLEEAYQKKIYVRLEFFLLCRFGNTGTIYDIMHHSRKWISEEDVRKTFEIYGAEFSDKAIKNIARRVLPFVYKLPAEKFLAESVEDLQKLQHKNFSSVEE